MRRAVASISESGRGSAAPRGPKDAADRTVRAIRPHPAARRQAGQTSTIRTHRAVLPTAVPGMVWEGLSALEAELQRLSRKPSPKSAERVQALLARALDESKQSYKAVCGALVHALRRSERRGCLPLMEALTALLCAATSRWGRRNLFSERLCDDAPRCVAAAARAPPALRAEVAACLRRWEAEVVLPPAVLARCQEALAEAGESSSSGEEEEEREERRPPPATLPPAEPQKPRVSAWGRSPFLQSAASAPQPQPQPQPVPLPPPPPPRPTDVWAWSGDIEGNGTCPTP